MPRFVFDVDVILGLARPSAVLCLWCKNLFEKRIVPNALSPKLNLSVCNAQTQCVALESFANVVFLSCPLNKAYRGLLETLDIRNRNSREETYDVAANISVLSYPFPYS